MIDIEVEAHTPSPTVDPSVRTILVGHSMGGIVAADTLLAITGDRVIEAGVKNDDKAESETSGFMFPYIQGVLAFDTPYLGISPGVVAHGAEGHYNTANNVMSQLSGISGMFWGGAAAKAGEDVAKREVEESKTKKPVAAIEAPPANVPAWQKWGKIAMYAGAATAVAVGAGAAYTKRNEITEGWTWIGSHLEFVGCLMRGEELKKRVAAVIRTHNAKDVGFVNLYTRLGQQAQNKDGSMVGSVIGNTRTFCNLPKGEAKAFFEEAINDAARDEISAHMMMFYPKDNPGFYRLGELARDHVVRWTSNDWYASSTGPQAAIEMEL